MTSRAARWGCALLMLLASAACSSDRGSPPPSASAPASTSPSTSPPPSARAPRWDHVVVVIMSSASYRQVIGSQDAPFSNLLARGGAWFTNAYAVARPAAPNYFALFSGDTYNLTSDACPHPFRGPNLATQLVAQRLSFTSYAEGLPAPGSRACRHSPYATAHNPPAAFANVPPSMLAEGTAFGTDFASLPAVSFVVPDDNNSMAGGDITGGDAWLRTEIAGYAAWATTHRSLLVVTWDQASPDDPTNHIPMLALGTGVRVGPVAQRVDHYSVLATIEDAFGLGRLGHAAGADAIATLEG